MTELLVLAITDLTLYYLLSYFSITAQKLYDEKQYQISYLKGVSHEF